MIGRKVLIKHLELIGVVKSLEAVACEFGYLYAYYVVDTPQGVEYVHPANVCAVY